MTGVLLAVDGDSLAHRAYHAIPKSIRGNGRPANALVGIGNFLLQLWESERPESVVVGWDSLETPTYRHEALPAYQSGREFEPAILEQLGRLPALTESFGFAVGKAPGFEADDFLAAAAATWPGPVSVVTSDRDAFQLVSDRVTVLQPLKGVSELARKNLPRHSLSVGETVGKENRDFAKCWSEWQDLNLRPPRPERGALPRPPRRVGRLVSPP